MPRHRLVFYFVDESPSDLSLWQDWVGAVAPPHVQAASEIGERRPYVKIAAPFLGRHEHDPRTPRLDELDGLVVVEALALALQALSRSTLRSVSMLLSGRPFGAVTAAGPDMALTSKLEEWRQLLQARPPDEPVWEREGYVSLWAGTLPPEDLKRLLEERYGTDSPISRFAKALGLDFYDHDFLESIHVGAVVDALSAIKRLSFAESFVDQIPADIRARLVNAVIAFYDADFSLRPCDAARKRLKFCGSYTYNVPAPVVEEDP